MSKQTTMQRFFLFGVVIILLGVGGGVYYYRPSFLAKKVQAPDMAAVKKSSVQVSSVVITASNNAFTPQTLSLSKGEKVHIIFKVAQGTHSFNIDAFNVHTIPLWAHGQEDVQFSADKIGSFPFYSSAGEDKAKGMKGTLVIH